MRGHTVRTKAEWRFVVAVACALLSACDSATGPPALPDVRRWVTGAALAALDENGHYVFPPASTPTPYPVVDEAAARDLAPAYLNTFAHLPDFWGPLELQHGAPIAVSQLGAASRVEYAETPYSTVPDSIPSWLRRSRGSAFLVRMTESGLPAVAVTVSRHAVELTIVNGRVRFPPEAGGEFDVYGMRTSPGFSAPIGPERATQVAAELTGARIAEIPVLLLPSWRFHFTFARWKLVLDRDITVIERQTGTARQTRVLYVGMQPVSGVPGGNPSALFIAAAQQPSADTLPGYIFAIRADIPVVFDEVTVAP